jgi:hypothetical protein
VQLRISPLGVIGRRFWVRDPCYLYTRAILVVILNFCTALMASSQVSDVPPSAPAVQVSAVSGAPLSAEQVEERSRLADDGAPTTRIVRAKIYRDRSGRMRVDWSLQGPDGASFPIANLIDPVSRFGAILLIPYKVAHRTIVPEPAEFRVAFPGLGEALPDVLWRTYTEDLGTRNIDGIEATGARVTRISDGQPPLRAAEERWSAKDLGLTLEVEATGPGWKHTVRLQKIERREPDGALFAIPADYRIEDAPR